MNKRCMLKDEKVCCCKCMNRRPAIEHRSYPTYKITKPIGYYCTPTEHEGRPVFIGDFEHGLCELFQTWEDNMKMYLEGRVNINGKRIGVIGDALSE